MRYTLKKIGKKSEYRYWFRKCDVGQIIDNSIISARVLIVNKFDEDWFLIFRIFSAIDPFPQSWTALFLFLRRHQRLSEGWGVDPKPEDENQKKC